MNILLTNDDGYDAPGILSLYNTLKHHHEVTLVAPDREKSAVGHGITLNDPLRIDTITLADGDEVYAINGTPADCVKLGLFEICTVKPDLVIAGINPGSNTGINIYYSGTAAAAREAAFNGILSLAVSIFRGGSPLDFQGVSELVTQLIQNVHSYHLPPGTFLNLNVPNKPVRDTRGIRVTRQSSNNLSKQFDKRNDPKNRHYFWYGNIDNIRGEEGTDVEALSNNFISLTPIQCDITNYEAMKQIETMGVQIDKIESAKV